MSGVGAFLDLRGGMPVRDRTARLLAALEVFGGDGGGLIVADGRVGLACAQMHLLPEDTFDRQPRTSVVGPQIVVADARLDNRAALAGEFDLTAATLATVADSALILHAYRRWGEECPRHLLGDFAFILWDPMREMLFCARDHMGKRVLFYHASDQLFAVASSARALLALPELPRRLNEEKIADYLVLVENAGTTFYDGVRRLPPAHTLTIGREGLTVRRYWAPDPHRRVILGSDEEYVEAFVNIFQEAVQCRLRTRGDVGVMMSGGLDSPSVAAVAATALGREGRELLAFHAAPPAGYSGAAARGWMLDESADVAEIAALHPNVRLSILRPDGRTLLEGLDTFFEVVGSPLRNPINRPWFEMLYEMASARGVRAMLSGQRGNATLSYNGAGALREYALAGQWRTLLREIRAYSMARGRPTPSVLRRLVLQPLAPEWALSLHRALRGTTAPGLHPHEQVGSPIHPAFAEEFRVDDRIVSAGLDARNVARADGRKYRMLMLAGHGDGADNLHGFRTRYGIESRDPTADVRVIEYCLAIPEAQYLRDGTDRYLVRRAMKGMLPEHLLHRTTLGTQAADWPEQITAIRSDIAAELERLRENPVARRALALDRMEELVRRWPDRLGLEHHRDYGLLLLRGIVLGRFLRWFEERTWDVEPVPFGLSTATV